MGKLFKSIKPRTGRQTIFMLIFYRPVRGLAIWRQQTHGFTVGYCRPLLRSFKQF